MPTAAPPRNVLFLCTANSARSILANMMFELAPLQVASTARGGMGQWLAEAIATFTLLGVILGAARYRPDVVAVCVGLVITGTYWFTSSTSFANPAVTIARSLSDTFAGIAPASVPGFVIAQAIGAVVAAIVFGWLFREERSER